MTNANKVVLAILGVVLLGGTGWLLSLSTRQEAVNPPDAAALTERSESKPDAPELIEPGAVWPGLAAAASLDENTVDLGPFTGKVSYDEKEGYYFLEFKGARLPFKMHPARALAVHLDAPGSTPKEKNTSLLYGVMGPDVSKVTLLVDPREEEQVMPAVEDLKRYISIVAASKLGDVAYTAGGGKPVLQIDDATTMKPIILLRGPKSGATITAVQVLGGGQFVIEGKTYDDLYTAADLVCMTIIKMLCGSGDCPDASACATGGSCGCG